MASPSPGEDTTHVAVVGAGVAGLSIALSLLDHPKNKYKVTIIAEHIPGDKNKSYPAHFASAWAGAHHVSDAQNEKELAWDQVTFNVMRKLVEQKPWKKHNSSPSAEPLVWVNQTELWSKSSNPNWKALDWYPEFKKMTKSQLPLDCSEGATFSTFDINVPVYLEWLHSEVISRGATFAQKKVDSLKEASEFGSFQLMIVAVGLGAKNLREIKDDSVNASRGQVLLVNAPWAKTRGNTYEWSGLSRVGDEGFRDVYVIPRGDDTFVVGGTRIKGDWDERPRTSTTQEIVRRVSKFAPQIFKPGSSQELDLISTNVGLRPVREGGTRLEVGSRIEDSKVIYAYGLGGFGYQASFGFSLEVRDLVDKSLHLPTTGVQSFRTLV